MLDKKGGNNRSIILAPYHANVKTVSVEMLGYEITEEDQRSCKIQF